MDRARADELVREFESVGLVTTDARRSAFCALACHSGWNAATIGRYLGISRARIGQRIERLYEYCNADQRMPILFGLLRTALPTESASTPALPVGFTPTQWDDEHFAMGLIYQMADHV